MTTDAYAERLRKEDWRVGPADPHDARRIIAAEHYALGVSKVHVTVHGLYRVVDDRLMGVSWWLPPTARVAKAEVKKLPDNLRVRITHQMVLTLSRLAIMPDVPRNAATFLINRSAALLPERWAYLLSYAETHVGHTGLIYKAAGWEDMGLTEPTEVWMRMGRVVSRKRGKITLTRDQMKATGAVFMGKFPKHKYRKILTRKRRRGAVSYVQKSLFEGM